MNPNQRPTQAKRILERLQQEPGEWVSMPTLAGCSGAYAVHSRVAELRTHGHEIEWKARRVVGKKTCLSFYRLVVPVPSPLEPVS